MFKRLFSCVLAFIMVFSILPIYAMAAEGTSRSDAINVKMDEVHTHIWTSQNDDQDHYISFYLEDKGLLAIGCSWPMDSDGYVYDVAFEIYDVLGALVWKNDTYDIEPTDTVFAMMACLNRGSYYMNIKPLFKVTEGEFPIAYALSYSGDLGIRQESEPNNEQSSADDLFGSTYMAVGGETGKNYDYWSYYNTQYGTYLLYFAEVESLLAMPNVKISHVDALGRKTNLTSSKLVTDQNGMKCFRVTATLGTNYVIVESSGGPQFLYSIALQSVGEGNAVSITKQPVSAQANAGSYVNVSFNATGDGLKYQWYYKDKGSNEFKLTTTFTGNTYSTVMNQTRSGRWIYCIVTDKYGNSVQTDTVMIGLVGESVASGKCGENAYWNLDNTGTLTITGTGSTTEKPWQEKHQYDIKKVVIEEGITEIGTQSFYRCELLSEVVFPASLSKIGQSAFSSCSKLNKIVFSTGLKTIGSFAFESTGIEVLKIPEGVVSIGERAFMHSYIQELTLPSSLQFIGEKAFADIDRLTKVTIEPGIEKLPISMFSSCDRITEIRIPEGVTWIGDSAFWGCSNLKTVYLPASLKTVGKRTFDDCKNLTEIYYAGTKETLETIAFSEDRSGIADSVKWHYVTPLAISRQPSSVTVKEGEQATVSFAAAGDGLIYKWYYRNKGTDAFLYTATFDGNTYVAQMNKTRDGREIYCVVTDRYGNSVKTNTVTINMDAVPVNKATITKQPQSVTVKEGEQAIVSFAATGDGLRYQWYYKNAWESKFSPTASFTGNTYSAQMNESRNGRQIYCVVTDQYGNSVSTDVVTIAMTVNPDAKLVITEQPSSVTVANGQPVEVQFKAEGDGLTYQWYYKNAWETKFSPTNTFKSNSYTTTMDPNRNGRQIYCVVTDRYGNFVQTETVTIAMSTVDTPATEVYIVQQPTSVCVKDDESVEISFIAEGDGLTYQWYYKNAWETKFSPTNTFKSNSYTTTMDPNRNGRQVYCVVTDRYGNSVQTDTVSMEMAEGTKLAIIQQPVSVKVTIGHDAFVCVIAEGEGLTYRWYYKNAWESNFSLTTTFTGENYSVKMDKTRDGRQLYCVITDKYGNSVRTDTVTISMY